MSAPYPDYYILVPKKLDDSEDKEEADIGWMPEFPTALDNYPVQWVGGINFDDEYLVLIPARVINAMTDRERNSLDPVDIDTLPIRKRPDGVTADRIRDDWRV